jgi:hypothetical protein
MGLLIERLDGETIDDLEMLMTSDVPSSQIADGLTAIGHPMQQGTLNRHRRGRCLCGRAR